MITFNGKYFDGKTAKRHRVSIRFDGHELTIVDTVTDTETVYPRGRFRLAPALGKTSRVILFDDGAKCETADHDAFSRFEALTGGNRLAGIIHLLEQRWQLVMVCFCFLVISVWLFTAYGIPHLAKVIAENIPAPLINSISDDALTIMDKQIFNPSALSEEKRNEIRKQVAELEKAIASGHQYRIEFRNAPKIGANAFALPSGTLIVTDDLVELIEEKRELTGILLHEMGHVEQRHGLRMVLQNTGVFFLISALAGDMVSITSVAGALPTLLVESGYSRTFETEADRYAAEFFLERGWDLKPYETILVRITKKSSIAPDMLSTHPGTLKRVKFLQSLDKQQGRF